MADQKNPMAERIEKALKNILKDGGSIEDAIFIISDMYGISAENIRKMVDVESLK